MSHFTVLVVGNNVEEALRPFCENTDSLDAEYLEFVDETDKVMAQYENDTIEMVKLADGSLKFKWDNMFSEGDFLNRKQVYPEGSKLVMVSFKEVYPTLEKFAEDYHGYSAADEQGRYGYTHNPNAKWDWYEIGGRWDGLILTKKNGHVNQCAIKDIDFEGMVEEKVKECKDKYARFVSLYGSEITPLEYKWKDILNDDKFKDMSIEDRRKFYQSQPQLKKIANTTYIPADDDLFMKWYVDYEEMSRPLSEQIEEARKAAFETFALLIDGEWYEKGEMGWWGSVSHAKPKDEWAAEFNKRIKELPEDTIVTVVDCHI